MNQPTNRQLKREERRKAKERRRSKRQMAAVRRPDPVYVPRVQRTPTMADLLITSVLALALTETKP